MILHYLLSDRNKQKLHNYLGYRGEIMLKKYLENIKVKTLSEEKKLQGKSWQLGNLHFVIFQNGNKINTYKQRFRYSLVSLYSSQRIINTNITKLGSPFKTG